jgi:hypothetical protein
MIEICRIYEIFPKNYPTFPICFYSGCQRETLNALNHPTLATPKIQERTEIPANNPG